MIYFFFDKEKMEHEKDLERWWMHLTKPSMVSTLKEHLYFFCCWDFFVQIQKSWDYWAILVSRYIWPSLGMLYMIKQRKQGMTCCRLHFRKTEIPMFGVLILKIYLEKCYWIEFSFIQIGTLCGIHLLWLVTFILCTYGILWRLMS